MLWLPPAWVPPFFVLSPDFYVEFRDCSLADRTELVVRWAALLEQALHLSGLDSVDHLHLRSNAVRETIAERGKYQSLSCERRNWSIGLQAFFERAAAVKSADRIGVVVQRYVKPLIFGHLSNARRVVREYRDAVIELTDSASGDMAQASLSFRRWRKSKSATYDALLCQRTEDLSTVLREPLAYAASQKQRVLYEWIWDGRIVYVVQADQAPDQSAGISPETLVGSPQDATWSESLSVFRRAEQRHAEHSRKLRSHFLYAQYGFKQPPFYIVQDPGVIRELLIGTSSAELRADLDALTKRPLVIRTSSVAGGGTLLPRSDLLHTAGEALAWLTGPFAEEIHRTQLSAEDLTLIAHHFIPAQAAAFSTGSPDSRDVYIEALWGIPEGLYYYPCDAYLVDTQLASASDLTHESKDRFRIRHDVRFKDTFVAPSADGKFVVCSTRPPWDWKSTIADDSIVREIAFFTRRLAGIELRRLKLMWFLGCASWAGLPHILPWYHDFEADDWTAASASPYQRNSRDEILSLHTLDDLQALEQKASAGYRVPGARRLIVSLNPAEDRIIRNEAVAERIGKAAHSLGAVLELQGGVLSHIYYSLRRSGADVSVRNRPRFAVRPVTFHKLVRDKIPSVVAAGGEQAKISHLAPEELRPALKIKLVEEAFEARDATGTDLVQELADVLEVVDALIEVNRISRTELQKVRRAKRSRRGGFKKGVVLLETRASPEEKVTSATPSMLSMLSPAVTDVGIVETNQAARLESTRPGPFDIREAEDFVEFVHTFDVGLTHPEWRLTSPETIRAASRVPADSIEWTIEGKREGARLKLRLKIRIGTRQLRLPFDLGSQVSPSD